MVLSHFVGAGPLNRLQWDREAARELIKFGKWILLSSATSFGANQGDRLLLASLLPLETLGIYAIAFFLSNAPVQLVSALQQRVLLPALSRVAREDRARLSEVYYRARLRIELLILPAAVLLIAAGPEIVDLLYDQRYTDAGWMVRILAFRLVIGVLSGPGVLCLVSLGRTKYMFLTMLSQAIWILALVPIAMKMGGLEAAIWVIGLYGIVGLCVVFAGLKSSQILSAGRELRSAIVMAVVIALGMLARHLLTGGA